MNYNQKTPTPVSATRFGYLDAVRGIAAVMVIYLHIADHFLKHQIPLADWEYFAFFGAARIVDLGKIAVTMFFAVSGFVIPFSLMKRRNHPLTGFAIGRFFRLYPAYWLSIAGITAVLILAGDAPTAPQILVNATMVQGFVGVENLQGLYWTLQIELVFYFLCAGLFFLGLLDKPVIPFLASLGFLALSIVMAYARYETGKALPVALPLALFMMFFGMVWRNATLDGEVYAVRQSRILIAAFVLTIPLVSVFAYNFDAGNGETWHRYTLSYFAAMLIFVLLTTVVKIQSPFFAWLGAISYSVYLFGWVCTSLLMTLFPALLYDAPAHLLVVLSILLTIVVSSVVYYGVEKPAIVMGRKVASLVDQKIGGTRTEAI
ncbi:acyltransferase [Qipengyuania gaetbuli]|uniref:acyltransferase family protein n=1 Tax=Qipengyuania gaetbuli TaxID=266952 RepID=UPI001C991357|nr:acyltransferase [Qipengyuania gaetbuli]MBY6013479.1 acyltransferase [Qipengyuania gaetbuli]